MVISVILDEVQVHALTPEGEAWTKGLCQEVIDLPPDEFLARIPEHLLIGLQSGNSTYLLRRPGLH